NLDDRSVLRVCGWVIVGGIGMLIAAGLTLYNYYNLGGQLQHTLLITTRTVAGGGAVGLGVGIYDAWRRMSTRDTEGTDSSEILDELHGTIPELLHTEDEQDVCDTLVRKAEELLDFPIVAVFLYDEESQILEPVASSEEVGRQIGRLPTLKKGETTVWESFDDGKPRVSTNKEDNAYNSNVPIRTEISLPLGDHGVLILGSRDSRTVSESDIHRAELLATNARAVLDSLERETELERELDDLVGLFTNMPNPCARYTIENGVPIIKAINPAFERTFGYDMGTIVGRSIDYFISPHDFEKDIGLITKELQKGNTLHSEMNTYADNRERDFLLHFVPIDTEWGNDSGYFIAVDITEQTKREQRLEVLNRVLRHDIRNDLSVIIGNAEILLNKQSNVQARAKAIKEKGQEVVELSYKARQIEETLKESGAKEPIDIVSLLENKITTIRRDYPDVDIKANLPDTAWVEASELIDSAMDNIIENAIEHNDNSDPKIEVSLSFEEIEGRRYVEVQVGDNGPGIPQDEIDVLKEGGESELRHMSGLGLWLINWIVNVSDGDLIIEDNEPRGTLIRVRLLQAEQAPKSEMDRTKASQ
ncbi:MAG: GAF domain-containing protein, partial [Halobacteria archaeon]|nr:GAF domain-containing protein [Halobacteria archaeon]